MAGEFELSVMAVSWGPVSTGTCMSELPADTPLLASLQVPEVTAVYLSSLPSALSKLSGAFFLFIAPLKVVWQASSLCYALLSADTTQYTLVQVTSVLSCVLDLE